MDQQVEMLHDASMKLLSEIGMEFQNDEICGLIKKNGVRVENNRAFFTEKQVNKYLDITPKEFTIKARNSKYDMTVSANSINFSPGYGCAWIADANGVNRLSLLDDYVKFAKLVHVSDLYKINGGILAQPNDIDAKLSAQMMIYSTIKLSDKCIFGTVGTKKTVQDIVNMASIAFGENIKDNYRLITLISPLSPLSADFNMLETLETLALNNQPVVIASGPMAGGTGPISLAGNIAMANAEILGLLAVTQMINPGTPVVYGSATTVSDLTTMRVSIGSPGFSKQAKYGARLAEKYCLPKRSGGSVTDARAVTAQAGVESAMSIFESFQENANFVMHSAGILESFNAMSYEKFILDIETLSRMNYYFDDLEINDTTLAIDVIRDVVGGKNFMSHKHTARRIRKDPWIPIVSKYKKLKPGETPQDAFMQQLGEQVEKMLAQYIQPELENLAELNKFMESLGVTVDSLEKIK